MSEGNAAAKTEGQVDVRNLQDKFHGLLDQRNEYNDLAREARQARDLLNSQRRSKRDELQVHKEARDRCNEKMRLHKEARNALQDQAKALIGEKKGKRDGVERSLPLRLRKARNEVESLLEKQETTVLDPAKENELVDKVRRLRKEVAELEAQMAEQRTVEVDLSDTDKAIDQLFSQADEEHENVKKWNDDAKAHHDKFVATIKELKVIGEEADQKHAEFIAYKKKADDYHNKAMELREQVMAVRGERRAEYQQRRKEIDDFNRQSRQKVNDPKAIEKAKESQLEQLKKGGKISLGF